MHRHDLPADVETKTHARAMLITMRLVEPLKELPAPARVYPDAGVLNDRLDLAVGSVSQLHKNSATVRAEFDGVVEQIRDHLLQAQRISRYDHRLRRIDHDLVVRRQLLRFRGGLT